MASIFDKQRLKAPQLRTVADRRFADAQYLLSSKQNKYANGAMYLGGFVIECLLKARLLEKYPWLTGRVDLAKRNELDREIYGLCYRSHDLTGIVELLPDLGNGQTALSGFSRLDMMLKRFCEEWTIFAWYSTLQANINEARDFLDELGELRTWLR